MITTMRIPLYIALETGGSADRAQIVKMMENVLIPDLVKHFTSIGSNLKLTREELVEIQKVCKPLSINILSGRDALQER